MTGATTEDEVRALRHRLGVRPVFKRIDTCAAEFEAKTPYMYSTYEAPSFGEPEDESQPTDRRKIVILGGGPNRIGQGIEFDYCCCPRLLRARARPGFETIMINCNPETVSTDYDTSDRLYFEPLTAEDVLEILHVEQPNGELVGVIVQFGGQTPLKLAAGARGRRASRSSAPRPTRSTSPRTASASPRWSTSSASGSPHNGIARSRDEAIAVARADRLSGADCGRATCSAGGRWRSSTAAAQLDDYIDTAVQVSGDSPVLIDQYLRDAIEVDVDAHLRRRATSSSPA